MQHGARQREENRSDTEDLQAHATSCNALFITRSWSRGKRFSSPLVGSLFTCKTCNKQKAPDVRVGGFVSSTSAVDYSKALPFALARYKRLQDIAGGAGEYSGIERLIDVPEYLRVRHRPKRFA